MSSLVVVFFFLDADLNWRDWEWEMRKWKRPPAAAFMLLRTIGVQQVAANWEQRMRLGKNGAFWYDLMVLSSFKLKDREKFQSDMKTIQDDGSGLKGILPYRLRSWADSRSMYQMWGFDTECLHRFLLDYHRQNLPPKLWKGKIVGRWNLLSSTSLIQSCGTNILDERSV